MTKYYEINGFYKLAECDKFETGCELGAAGQYIEYLIQQPTVETVIQKAMDFIGLTDKGAVCLNACEETGRVDFQVHETNDGTPASESDFEAWKKGKCDLWLCTYSATVKEIESREVDLIAALGG